MLLSGLFFLWGQKVYAMDVNIHITGVVYIPPCKINGNDTEIQVSFKQISLHEIDGYNNAVTKTVSVNCDFYLGTPYIRMDGIVLPGAGENVLKTTGVNASILGIALYQGGEVNNSYPLRIGAGAQGKYGYKVTRGLTGKNTSKEQFTFTAVPRKYGSEALKAGAFSATATMSISYL